MSDWSEHYLKAQQALKRAENSLNLKRNAEGAKAVMDAILALDDCLTELQTDLEQQIVRQ